MEAPLPVSPQPVNQAPIFQPIPPPVPLKQSNKIIIAVIAVVVLVIVIAGAASAAFILQSKKNIAPTALPSPTPSPSVLPSPANSADPSALLKTYQNKDLKISFQYPSEWTERLGSEQPGEGDVLAWFSKGEGEKAEKLRVRFVTGESNPLAVAQAAIAKNNCASSDRVTSSGDTFAMYVLGCSMSSARYVDTVKVNGGVLTIEHQRYSDDPSADASNIIRELTMIGKSVRSIQPNQGNQDNTESVALIPYSNPTGFEIEYPANWIAKEIKGVDASAGGVLFSSPGTSFQGSEFSKGDTLEQAITVVSGASLSPLTFQKLRDGALNEASQQTEYISRTLIDDKAIKISGQDAYEVVYSESNRWSNTTADHIRIYTLPSQSGVEERKAKLAQQNGVYIILEYTARKDIFDRALAEKIFGTFKESLINSLVK